MASPYKEYEAKLQLRVKPSDKAMAEAKARALGYPSVSAMLRDYMTSPISA